MPPKDYTVIGIDWGSGPSQTFYTHTPRSYEKQSWTAVSERKRWGIELLVDLRAVKPGPEQKKYQKVQLEIRKARAHGA